MLSKWIQSHFIFFATFVKKITALLKFQKQTIPMAVSIQYEVASQNYDILITSSHLDRYFLYQNLYGKAIFSIHTCLLTFTVLSVSEHNMPFRYSFMLLLRRWHQNYGTLHALSHDKGWVCNFRLCIMATIVRRLATISENTLFLLESRSFEQTHSAKSIKK